MKKIIYGILLVLGIIAFSSVTKTHADYNASNFVFFDPLQNRTYGYVATGKCAGYVNYSDGHFVGNFTANSYGLGNTTNLNNSMSPTVYTERNFNNNYNGRVWQLYKANFPIFNNATDFNNYMNGLPFNSSNIIGGTVPVTYSFANDDDYVPFHAHAEGFVELLAAGLGGSIKWNEDYIVTTTNTPPNFHHIAFNIHYKMPTRESLYNTITNQYISREFTWRGLISDEIDWVKNNNSGRYTNNGISYADYTYPLQLDTTGALSMSYTMTGYDGSQLYNSSVVNNAIRHFYGDPQGSIFDESYVADILHAAMFVYIDYVEVHYVAYNESSHKYISYPSLFYYPDLLNYDMTIYRKRDINSTPTSTKPTGDISESDFNNTGNVTYYPSKDSDYTTQLQNLLDSIVIDNGDTVINNYIDGVGGKLEDWWNDGDIDINKNIGDLYSLLKSVANIGLIFGLVFNGFIPNTALVILGFALLLIPIVLIIKLIRG